ncbi:MAG: hypothetical protein NTX50_02285 [Candidatus Sumerlaeota bacterium]|nr:hypothetical protein [Candidatus Sumerlaeota bacterium]
MIIELRHIPFVAAYEETEHRIMALVVDGKSDALAAIDHWKTKPSLAEQEREFEVCEYYKRRYYTSVEIRN